MLCYPIRSKLAFSVRARLARASLWWLQMLLKPRSPSQVSHLSCFLAVTKAGVMTYTWFCGTLRTKLARCTFAAYKLYLCEQVFNAGIRYVVDSGRAKQKLLEDNVGLARFEVRWVSKASAEQRSGRAGRTGPGHCYR